MIFRSRLRAFTLVEVLAACAVAGLLLALIVGIVRTGIQKSREQSIRANLQNVWVAANHYLLENQLDEVMLADLAKSGQGNSSISQIQRVLNEDYTTVNGGKIKRTDSKLEISYDGGRTITYKTVQ